MARDASLVFRWSLTCDFPRPGWSKSATTVTKLATALASTKTWKSLPSLAVGLGAGAPYAGPKEIARVITSGASRLAVVTGGKNPRSDSTTGWIELVMGSGAVELTCALRGRALEALGVVALDDFFATALALRAGLPKELHVVTAHAWCDWRDAVEEPSVATDWPPRAIADVLEPNRPPWDEDDPFLKAAKRMAKAKVPAGVERSTSKGLVMLRWTKDPRAIADVAAASERHVAWVTKTAPTEDE